MSASLGVRRLRIVRESAVSHFELEIGALDLEAGQVLAVLGANGSGKSTLLRALAGLEPLEAGEVIRHATGPVTMVFQRPIALAGSVVHNVRIALRSQGLDPEEISRRSDEALARFGITDLAPRPATALSGGEVRRLALARAFAIQPAVLLLDEPFDDLDAGAQESLTRDLRRAVAETGVAVAVVTHDLRRAVRVCDRIAVLLGGALRQTGDRDEVLNRPVDRDVAGLVGMTNLLPAEIDTQGLARIDAQHAIPTLALGRPGPAWIGLRPEHLKVDIGRGEGSPIGPGRVTEHASDGILTTLEIAWAGHSLRTHLVAGRGMAREIAMGDELSLALRPEDVHVFPICPPGEKERSGQRGPTLTSIGS
jgi:ABC-type sulfate/molybdate transport systems ATPase subunit